MVLVWAPHSIMEMYEYNAQCSLYLNLDIPGLFSRSRVRPERQRGRPESCSLVRGGFATHLAHDYKVKTTISMLHPCHGV